MKRFLIRLLFFSLIVWALGEILTRIFIPIDPRKRTLDRTEEHPYIRTDWVPGFERTYIIEGIAGQTGTMEFKINPFGFRSASMKTKEKPSGTYRLFFLGGSTTESLYLPEEKTFPFLVERKLTEGFPGLRFESINGGISGYLAADTLALFIYKVTYYEPDIVIVMLSVNDLLAGSFPDYDPIRRTNYRKTVYGSESDENPWRAMARLFKRSHFLTLIKWRLVNRIFPPDAEKYKTSLEQYEVHRRGRRSHPFTPLNESKGMDDFVKHMKEIISIAQGHGVRLILMTEPSVYQENLPPEMDEKLWMGWLGAIRSYQINLSNEFLTREMRRFNDAVRELARTHGIELIDLEREIPKDLQHFYDDVHLTPFGAEKAARAITSYLLAHPEKLK